MKHFSTHLLARTALPLLGLLAILANTATPVAAAPAHAA